MGLNIKNKEAHRLAEELAKLTGESMATAVTIAVRERLDHVRREQGLSLADRLLAIGRDCAAHLREPSSADHGTYFMMSRITSMISDTSALIAMREGSTGLRAGNREQRGPPCICRQFR